MHCVKNVREFQGFFLVCIFLYSDWIQRFTKQIFVFSTNKGKWAKKPSDFGHFSRRVAPISTFRSNHQRCSNKKAILKNFVIFKKKLQIFKNACFDKHLQTAASKHWLYYVNHHLLIQKEAVSGLRPATLLKKRLWHSVFLWILRNF